MHRIVVSVIGLAVALGVATFAVAQDGTPTPEAAIACATPLAATPEAATPMPSNTTSGTPVATPDACASVEAGATTVTIELVDIAFKPTDVTIAAGVPVEITLTNAGLALHNFEQKELGISVDLGPGQSETIIVTVPAGDYDFICNIPGHAAAGMVGVLHAR